MRCFYQIVSWPQVKAMLTDKNAYYIERDGWFTIVLPEAAVECEFPDEQVYDAMEPGMRVVYQKEWAQDFRTNFKSKLVRSSLSNEDS